MLILLSMLDFGFPLIGGFVVFGTLMGLPLFFGLLFSVIFAGIRGSRGTVERTEYVPTGKATHKDDDEPVRRVVDTTSRVDDGRRTEASSSRLTNEDVKRIREAQQNILEGRNLAIRIKDPEVRLAAADALDASEKIVGVLKNQPEEIRRSKQFLNYYVPTLNVIIKKYRTVEDSGIEMTETRDKILNYFSDIMKALKKQYESLFENDKLDLTVEMEAMELAFKRDGMISDEELKAEQAGSV